MGAVTASVAVRPNVDSSLTYSDGILGVTSPPVSYSGIDVTALPAAEDIISQGYLSPLYVHPKNSLCAGPGFIAQRGNQAGDRGLVLLMAGTMANQADSFVPAIGGRRTRVSIKGTVQSANLTKFDAASECIALGVGLLTTGMSGFEAVAGHSTETTRDDEPQMAIIVDASGNIQRYNNDAAGDASYTDADSGAVARNADLTVGMGFEIIIETGSTAAEDNDMQVTIKAEDDGGTMRTFFSAAAPIPATASGELWSPFIMINCAAFVSKLVYKIEKVA